MKKKLLSLFLCLALCVPFVLTSCTIPNLTNTQKKEPTFIDDILCLWENKDSYDSASAFVPDGKVATSNQNFVYTVGGDYADESIGLSVEKTHYCVYNLASGALVFEDYTFFDMETRTYTSESMSISVTLLNKMIFVIKASAETGKESSHVYDENGNELLKTDGAALTVVDDDRIILADKLYVLENGTLEMKKNLSDISYSFRSIITKLTPYGDRYVYIDGTMVYVFDQDYSFLYKKALKQTQGSTFAEEKYSYFTLENGNVIFQTTYCVGEYSTLLQSYTYDFISNGKCYKLDSFLLDIRSGSYTEVEIPYILKTVVISDSALPYGAQNVGAGQKIDGKKLVTTNGATYGSFLLFNSGKTSGMPSVDGSANITVVNENRFFVENDFSVKVYNENAELIGTLSSYSSYNEKFIITDHAIYNYNLEVVYSLADNNAAVCEVTADSVIVTSYDRSENESTMLLVQEGREPVAINDDVSVFACKYFFATVNENNGAKKIAIYKTNGDLISEYAIHENSGFENTYEHDNYVVFETTSIEGKTMYITVFKTEKI